MPLIPNQALAEGQGELRANNVRSFADNEIYGEKL